jgi:hypothetical protein
VGAGVVGEALLELFDVVTTPGMMVVGVGLEQVPVDVARVRAISIGVGQGPGRVGSVRWARPRLGEWAGDAGGVADRADDAGVLRRLTRVGASLYWLVVPGQV